ncbi:hypothetical protein H4R34_002151 [Dimargaris verticillata]|uniref:Uncharacterized protein n=1 Tax=Dimargaris verticillata TaxID=2761393 RepID=A0A9W8EDU2_9FUNG|nr:hypothetical protein H4R34_002151 [Dimargaris verticillata]
MPSHRRRTKSVAKQAQAVRKDDPRAEEHKARPAWFRPTIKTKPPQADYPSTLLDTLSPSSLYRSFSAPDNLAHFPTAFFSPPILPPDFYAPPYYARRRSLPLADSSGPDTTQAWGYALLLATFCFFALGLYTVVISKFMPATGNRILDAIRQDQYYCFLLPLTLTVAFYTVIWNWVGMKLFRHN